MRLIHTKTYQFKEFIGYEIPQYAILSHTWGKDEDEVSYKDIGTEPKPSSAGNDEPGVIGTLQKPGAVKIRGCCNIASRDGFQWLWIDTCCIDKSSSAELTEAINSMYAYYERSARCYVYLADVSNTDADIWSSVRSSRWFTRGWTLQELLAPRCVVFYSNTWKELGMKSNIDDLDISPEFLHLLSSITKIDTVVLLGFIHVHSATVSQRMSWAAGRETRRIEDRAYSLLGIFNVNMPMLYGEEERAFVRLQEEIMKDSDDHSLFAWKTSSDPDLERGLLAWSPDDFAGSGRIIKSSENQRNSTPYSKTNRGLSISLRLFPSSSSERDLYLAHLECQDPDQTEDSLALYLTRLGASDQFVRVHPHILIAPSTKESQATEALHHLYVRQITSTPAQNNIILRYCPSQTPRHRLTRLQRADCDFSRRFTEPSFEIRSEVQFNFGIPAKAGKPAAVLMFTSKVDRNEGIAVMIGNLGNTEIGWRISTKNMGKRWFRHALLFPAIHAARCTGEGDQHCFPEGSGLIQDGYQIMLGVHHDTSKRLGVMNSETNAGAWNCVVHLEIKPLKQN